MMWFILLVAASAFFRDPYLCPVSEDDMKTFEIKVQKLSHDVLHIPFESPCMLVFSPDDQSLLVGDEFAPYFDDIRIPSGRTRRVRIGNEPDEHVMEGEFSKCGRFLALATSDRVLVLETKSFREVLSVSAEAAHDIAITPDSKDVVFAGWSGAVCSYCIRDKKRRSQFVRRYRLFDGVEVSSDGKTVGFAGSVSSLDGVIPDIGHGEAYCAPSDDLAKAVKVAGNLGFVNWSTSIREKMAIASSYSLLTLVDIGRRELIGQFECDDLRSGKFLDQSTFLAYAESGCWILFNLTSGSCKRAQAPVNGLEVAISHDKTKIALSKEGGVNIYSTEKLLMTFGKTKIAQRKN